MSSYSNLIIVVLTGVAVWLIFRHRRLGLMPACLGDVSLFMNERRLSMTSPIALHGQVDQVYKHADGTLTICDTKTRARDRTYRSDVVQLSLYALILDSAGYRVRGEGLVRVVTPSGTSFHPVRLLDPDSCIRLYHRYQAIKSGSIFPRCTCSKHKRYL